MKGYEELLQKLSVVVKERNLQPGDKLPPERELAPLIGVSRNTLRNTLHKLEACRLVSIRRGSGTFLHSCLLDLEDTNQPERRDSTRQIAEQCEAAYLMLPIIAAQSAENIGIRLIDKLQHCNVALSRSLLSGSTSMVFDDIVSFLRMLAQGANNQYLMSIMEQICAPSDLFGEVLFRLTQEQRGKLFASHVKLIHALRERNSKQAAALMQRYVLFISNVAEEHCGVRATDLVFAAMQEYEEEWL
ncbi:GntR family transcriptional regulator [Halodesulfovibrio sp.]|uniref:FadR/GntR family transcriptional regulator n=1 Tax=Halodesulfovibrio sp. TaxID=1912772 RepID=UPI0026003A71|nr:GntR family transcriptional regulator [Halodesulfovibrio sp.]MCT4534302.1 GntR family transcriptional regulator [Halodesulfovibrio sp.]MCT4625804.1 GntR family transcriptional regulator [Halodesulfovibrio sp.]